MNCPVCGDEITPENPWNDERGACQACLDWMDKTDRIFPDRETEFVNPPAPGCPL